MMTGSARARGRRAGARRLHQRARHLDAARRRRRDEGDQGRVRRPRLRARGLVDEVDDGPHIRSRRRDRGDHVRARAARRPAAADDQLPRARPRLRPRLRAERGPRRAASTSPCRMRWGSAATTAASCSAARPEVLAGKQLGRQLRRPTATTASASGERVVVGREVRVGHGDDAHARRLRRADAVVRVLDRRARGPARRRAGARPRGTHRARACRAGLPATTPRPGRARAARRRAARPRSAPGSTTTRSRAATAHAAMRTASTAPGISGGASP